MSNSGMVVPPDVSQILNERANIWGQLDQAENQLAAMEKLSSQIVVNDLAQIPSELTSEKTPPAEIAAAYQGFQTEMARIADAREGIRNYQAEIKKIESQRTTTMILVGLGIVVLIVITVCGGIVVLNTILSNIQR